MTLNNNRVILFANGALPAPENLRSQISSSDFLIAVDGGLNHMTALGLTPNLIIGDLDSVSMEKVDHFRSQGVEVRKYPVEKDQTDLELALDIAQEMAPSEIWIVAALGKRLDHSLGNIFLLTRPTLANYDTRLIDGQQEVFVIRKTASITGMIGQTVSLLPLNGPVLGITTEGLKYPLVNETLMPEKTRGVSNQLTATSAKITIQGGLLLCIHQTTDPNQRIDKNE